LGGLFANWDKIFPNQPSTSTNNNIPQIKTKPKMLSVGLIAYIGEFIRTVDQVNHSD
jgi:hypothetical protein